MNKISVQINPDGTTAPARLGLGRIGEHNATALVFSIPEELEEIEYFRVLKDGKQTQKLLPQNREVECPVTEEMLMGGDGFLQLAGYATNEGSLSVIFLSEPVGYCVSPSLEGGEELSVEASKRVDGAVAELEHLVERADDFQGLYDEAMEIKNDLQKTVAPGSGKNSLKFGNLPSNTAAGENSVSGGNGSSSHEWNSLSLGERCTSHNRHSFSFGRESTSYAPLAKAMGYKCIAGRPENAQNTDLFSLENCIGADASGWEFHALHSFAQVYGLHNQSSRQAQLVCGQWNADNPDAVLIIGGGSETGGRKNAFEVTKNAAFVGGKPLAICESGSWTPLFGGLTNCAVRVKKAQFFRIGQEVRLKTVFTVGWNFSQSPDYSEITISGLPYIPSETGTLMTTISEDWRPDDGNNWKYELNGKIAHRNENTTSIGFRKNGTGDVLNSIFCESHISSYGNSGSVEVDLCFSYYFD